MKTKAKVPIDTCPCFAVHLSMACSASRTRPEKGFLMTLSKSELRSNSQYLTSDEVRSSGNTATRRSLEPFTATQLLVFTRSVDGPFSCRLRSRSVAPQLVTVLGVLMPHRDDPQGVPILRSMSAAEYYYELQDRTELGAILDAFIHEVSYIAKHGSIEQLQHVVNLIKDIAL